MKRKLVASAVMAVAAVMAAGSPAKAADFWDMIATRTDSKIIGTGVTQFYVNSYLNRSNFQATWVEIGANGGLPGVFDGFDLLSGTLDIYDRNGNLALQSPPNLDRPQVDAWAAANAAAIFNILFPNGISELTGITDDNILVSTTVSQNLFTKAVPAKKGPSNSAAAARNENAEASAEYQKLTVNDYHARAASLVMGFSKAAESGFSYTLTVPYRTMSINDEIGSRSKFIGMEMAAKYPVLKWDKNVLNLGGCLFGSAYELKTENMDKSGNLKYGGGGFTSLTRDLGFGSIGVGLDYRMAKAKVPSSLRGNGMFTDLMTDYINNHSETQAFSYGVNLGIPVLGDAAALNFEVLRSNFMGDDIPSGQKGKTSVGLSGAFYPSETFELNLGIKRDYGIDKVKGLGFMLGVINRF